jgi:hypothetical protein
VVDRQLVEDIANRIRPGGEGLIEKDWHVVRAISVLASLDHGEARAAFSGGTSLSIGWGLIKRFSEDVDFKVGMPAAENPSRARAQRRTYRQKVLDALEAAGFELAGEPFAGKVSGFFSADFAYPSEFAPAPGLRPHLRIEMTFESPALPPIERPIRSLIAQAQGHAPEVPTFPCVDPVETAADKLSALAWRVCVRDRRSEKDDPTIIRHLHDLAALEARASASSDFAALLAQAARKDIGRGGGRAPTEPAKRIAKMLERLGADALWAEEYEEFVNNVSFAAPDELTPFATALAALSRLAGKCI